MGLEIPPFTGKVIEMPSRLTSWQEGKNWITHIFSILYTDIYSSSCSPKVFVITLNFTHPTSISPPSSSIIFLSAALVWALRGVLLRLSGGSINYLCLSVWLQGQRYKSWLVPKQWYTDTIKNLTESSHRDSVFHVHLHQPQCDIWTETYREWQFYSAPPCSFMASGPFSLRT